MIKLSCNESGLECDYVAEGKTVDEVLKDISEHSVNVHNMKKIHLQHFYAKP
jgi:predicted small metal-binding protein